MTSEREYFEQFSGESAFDVQDVPMPEYRFCPKNPAGWSHVWTRDENGVAKCHLCGARNTRILYIGSGEK